jgi:hypothetical protein
LLVSLLGLGILLAAGLVVRRRRQGDNGDGSGLSRKTSIFGFDEVFKERKHTKNYLNQFQGHDGLASRDGFKSAQFGASKGEYCNASAKALGLKKPPLPRNEATAAAAGSSQKMQLTRSDSQQLMPEFEVMPQAQVLHASEITEDGLPAPKTSTAGSIITRVESRHHMSVESVDSSTGGAGGAGSSKSSMAASSIADRKARPSLLDFFKPKFLQSNPLAGASWSPPKARQIDGGGNGVSSIREEGELVWCM